MTKVPLIKPSHTHACGYFDNRQSNNEYLHPDIVPDAHLLSLLNHAGFRRSGKHIYRPSCPGCNECVSVRIPVDQFRQKRRFKRVTKALKHWQLSVEPPSETHYPLYERYITARHSDGSMFPPKLSEFQQFLLPNFGTGHFLVAREENNVRACLAFDRLMDGLSSIYCFFDPDVSEASPGTFMIVSLTQLTRALGLPYHYLGYWVDGCQKMEYKRHFQPLEYYIDNQWRN